MDGQRFDELTRLIGSGSSRRRVLRLLAGSVLGAAGLGRSPARAQECTNPPSCLVPDECCIGFDCVDGVCSDRLPEPCLPGGTACNGSEECCSGECLDSICTEEAPLPPCVDVGGPCAESVECCEGACVAGVCETPEPPCAGEFESCLDGCCGGLYCDQSENTCKLICKPEGRGCFDTDEVCCAGLVCATGWVCIACPAEGEACVDGFGEQTCCGDLVCEGGVCAQHTCTPAGGVCDGVALCCEGLSCVEGICAETTCVPEGGACTESAACCGDLVCGGGACRPPDDGTDGGGTAEPGGAGTDTPGDTVGDADEPVTALPDTGTGGGRDGRESLVGVSLAAVGAALLGRTLRRDRWKVPDGVADER